MFNPPMPETSLQDSWITGAILNAPLIQPVIDARSAIGLDESLARKLRTILESVFELWKDEFGTSPDDSHGGLLGSPYAGLSVSECPPYVCAGAFVRDYADLLAKLRTVAFKPLSALDKKFGSHRVSASLVLSEAAEGRIESVAKVHLNIRQYEHDAQAQHNKITAKYLKTIEPFVETGQKIKMSASLGHEHTHGTPEEKANRWSQYLADCLAVALDHPSWKLNAIRAHVAESHIVSAKTIERHTLTLAEELAKRRK